MDGARGKLVLLCASVLVALVLSEGALRILDPYPEVSHERGSGTSELPPRDATYAIPDDRLGWKLRPDMNLRLSLADSYDVTITSNSKGIRDRREFSYTKPPGTLRILALGDSFTFGTGVENDETWPARLEFHLREAGTVAEVINAGVGAYGTDQTYLYYLAEGAKYGADLVVIGYCPCHMRRNATGFFIAPKPRFVRTEQTLTLVPPAATVSLPAANPLAARSYLYRYVNHAFDTLAIVPSYFSIGEAYRITALLYENLARDIQADDSRVIVAYVPRKQEITSRWSFMLRKHERAFSALITGLGVDIVDLAPEFRRGNGPSLFLRNEMGHVSKVGNDLIGLTLARHIIAHRSLASSR